VVKILTGLLMLYGLLRAQAPVRVAYACPAADIDSFGLTCSEDDPCTVLLELGAIQSAGARLFVTGNLHTSSLTLYGVLLASEDGGKTWAEPHKRIRAGALDQIEFLDLQYGWITGDILEPLPKDPFLLITNDGGATWRERPLFEESRFGSIAEFGFESRSAGELIFDRSQGATKRYERYQTNTGGDEWTPIETSTSVLHLKKPPPKVVSAWRVRADGPSKAYRVETGSGADWRAVATFPVEVASCK
jgi:hypothetical protein